MNYLESVSISVIKRCEHGDPTEQILTVADEIDTDGTVMSGRKRSPTGKVLFGSVVQSVMPAAECPVITSLSDKWSLKY
jgi:Universal stress protein UspA and related nucleotide-binding proteins